LAWYHSMVSLRAASKAVTTWAKGRQTFAIKGGIVEGRVVGPAEIADLAALPAREVLLARVAGAFQAPLQGLLQVLAAPLQGLVGVLDEVRKQKEGAA